MKVKKAVLLVVLAGLFMSMVVMAGTAEAAATKPRRHAPQCLTELAPNQYYKIGCVDVGRDIVDAGVLSMGTDLKVEATWDGKSASIIVYFPVASDTPPFFSWYVSDKAGNVTRGQFPDSID